MKWEGSSNDTAMAFSELNWEIKFAWPQICKQYYAPNSKESLYGRQPKSYKRQDDRKIFSVMLFNGAVPDWVNEVQTVISMLYVWLVKLPLGLAAVSQNNQPFKSAD